MKINLNKSHIGDKFICFIVCLIVISLYIINITHSLGNTMSVKSSDISMVFKILIGIGFIISIPIVIHRFTYHMLLYTLTLLTVVVLNILIFPENNSYFVDNTITYFSFCFSACILVCVNKKKEILIKYLNSVACIIAVINLAVLFLTVTSRVAMADDVGYSMGFGYACIVPALLLVKDIYIKSSIYNIIGFIGLIIAIIMYGSRGPLLCVGLFILYLFSKDIFSKNKLIPLVLSFLGIIFIMIYKDLLRLLNEILSDHFGVYSRTLNIFLVDDVHLSGRDFIYGTLLSEIFNSPFTIRGINAEWRVIGTYAHNIIIEICYQFGLIFGIFILSYIAYVAIKNLKCDLVKDVDILKLIFLFASLPALVVSGSLWSSYYFWIWIGLNMGKGDIAGDSSVYETKKHNINRNLDNIKNFHVENH